MTSLFRSITQGLFLMLITLAPQPSGATDLASAALAHFKFAVDGKDALNKCTDASLRNVEFTNNVMHINGVYQNSGKPEGYRAVAPISGLQYNHFTVSLDFWANDFDEHQKSGFDHSVIITGGESFRWLGLNHGDGHLTVFLNNQEFKHEFTNEVIAVKKWHNLICAADMASKEIRIAIDGRALAPLKLPAELKLEVVGSTAEKTDNNFTFTNYSNSQTFHGYAANLKVFSRALTPAEMKELFQANASERPVYEPPVKKRSTF